MLLKKAELEKILERLGREYELWGPVETEGKVYSFRRLNSPGDLALGYRNSVVSPKSVFLPSGETVFTLEAGKPVPPAPPARPIAVVGIRPCDARALVLLDRVFGGEVEDSLYLAKRKYSLLIGLACNDPGDNCFCVPLGGSPFAEAGLDLLLIDLGKGKYALRGVSEKGKTFASSLGKEDGGLEEKTAALEKRARDRIEIRFSLPESLPDSPEYWRRQSLACIDCGICSFLCPTCHCFDLADEAGRRLRLWDACSFPRFTKMTSGENPRQLRRERLRNRVFHKFSWFKEIHGEVACVGCGRCLEHCPAGIKITDLAKGAQSGITKAPDRMVRAESAQDNSPGPARPGGAGNAPGRRTPNNLPALHGREKSRQRMK